jgi:RES domain-containing protein
MPRRAVRVCARTYDPQRSSGRANRWNAAEQRVLYLSEHFGTAVLETIVHADLTPPPPSVAAWATIPDDVSVEELDAAALLAGWDDPDDSAHARRIGAEWYREMRSACLVVPSIPGRPFEYNLVLNTRHPDAARIHWDAVVEIPWDERLLC